MQVGLELEVVSKDERDLIQGRAELEALLTQQRSAQAAHVQSPPSTSVPQDSSQVLSHSVPLFSASCCQRLIRLQLLWHAMPMSPHA